MTAGRLRSMTAHDQAALAGTTGAGPRNDELRAAATVTAALIVLGAVLGFVWAAWSPARPPGVQLPAGTVQINESEAFAAGDGRFAIIAAVVGLAAGIGLWWWRSVRGPWIALALVAGGLAGAWTMEKVGHAAGGGTNSGPPQTAIRHLPLDLHMTGLYALEALLAVLVYSVLVAFAVDDDLGRPDPERDAARRTVPAGWPGQPDSPAQPEPPAQPDPLVQPEYLVQNAGAHGDGAGLPQQGQLPTQDPGQGA